MSLSCIVHQLNTVNLNIVSCIVTKFIRFSLPYIQYPRKFIMKVQDWTRWYWIHLIHALWAPGQWAMTSAALAPVTRSLLSTPQHEQIAALDILPEGPWCEWFCCWRKENESKQISLARLPRNSRPWRQGKDTLRFFKCNYYYLARSPSVEAPSSAPDTSSLRPTASWTSVDEM